LELSDLKVFCAVVELGGINRAAESLHRVPSNVTTRIKKLEEDLGQTLFIREKNRLSVSASGEQLLKYAKSMLKMAEDARAELNHSGPTGVLKIASMEAVAASRLTNVLQRYHQAHPSVTMKMSTGPTGRLLKHIESGELDVALVADTKPNQTLHSVPVYEEELILVSSLSHAAIVKSLDIEPGQSVLAFNSECAYRSRLMAWLGNLATQRPVIEIQSYHSLLSCVAAGMGVGLVPKALLDQYAFKADVKAHPLPKKFAKTVTTAICRKDNMTASVMAFFDELQAMKA